MGLRTEYIFFTKYITMAIKTSNTKLIIPVVMIRIVALHFFTFTVGCSGMLHFLCFVSNRNLKGFSSKQYDKACKTPLTVPRTLPVTSTVRDSVLSRVIKRSPTLVRVRWRALLKHQSIFYRGPYRTSTIFHFSIEIFILMFVTTTELFN